MTIGPGSDHYYEDLQPGMQFVTQNRTITETDIVNFAMFSGDWNRIHVDAATAAEGPLGGRVMHGVGTLAIVGGLIFSGGWFVNTTEALLGFDELRFSHPVRVGDTINAVINIESLRVSRSGRGIVVRSITARRVDAVDLMTTTSPIILKRR